MSGSSSRQRVGIEKIWAYPGTMALDFEQLARARGAEAGYPSQTLLVNARTVNPCWEDPLTMAVNAADPLLSDEDRRAIELLIVGTESSPDQGKPLSTFAHRFLRLSDNCRNFETKHACYGGAAAAMMAAHWVASGAAGDAKALVLATDQARMHLGSPWEYVLGAGAVALLISNKPDVLEFELETNGYWTNEVGDTFRPTSRHEAGNTENSVYCYLEALEGAFAHFQRKVGNVDYDGHFHKHVYHVPFGGMAYRAHRTLLRSSGRVPRKQADANFDRKVRPGLTYNSQFGGTYTASTFLALMGLVDQCDDLDAGDRISMFAYGSGSCAELYSAVIGPRAKERVAAVGLHGKLAARYQLSVEQYEAIEHERTTYIDEPSYEPPRDRPDPAVWEQHYAGRGLLVLRGLDGFFRYYERS